MLRNKKEYMSLYVKGIMMGAADVVPGVSGGTIAFITGIYQELIRSLSCLGPSALKVLFSEGLAEFWRYINGTFLVVLMLGIVSSLLLLSSTVLYLLQYYPQMLWGFFFGLICASSIVLFRSIEQWSLIGYVSFILGVIVSYILTTQSTAVIEPSVFNIFFAGMLAICAMILPGISGSFILLLLGMYSYILTAIKDFDFAILATFAVGCFMGLLSFSKLLNFLFKHYRNATMALLTGFLLGSLNKVWPWKETLTTRLNSHGEYVPDSQQNISPFLFQDVTGDFSYFGLSCLLAIVGGALVLVIEKFNK